MGVYLPHGFLFRDGDEKEKAKTRMWPSISEPIVSIHGDRRIDQNGLHLVPFLLFSFFSLPPSVFSFSGFEPWLCNKIAERFFFFFF